MYTPTHFRNDDRAAQLAFLTAHPFGLLLSNGAQVPLATYLPLVTEEHDGQLLLHSHLAAVNPQAQQLQNGAAVCVIFGGPHAYISPTLYTQERNVPTWNYISVQATGTCRLLSDDETVGILLRRMVSVFEPSWQEKFSQLDPAYYRGLLKGITAFTIAVEQLEASYKLSQNKTTTERTRIIDHLLEATDPAARELGLAMQQHYTSPSSSV